jgi:hypothetical protein
MIIALAHSFNDAASALPRSPSVASVDDTLGATAAIGDTLSEHSTWWMKSATTPGQSALFILSSLYFCFDLLSMYMRGRTSSPKHLRIVLHHVLSIACLVSSVVMGADGPMVLLGFLLGEVAAPPLHLLTLCKLITRSNIKLRCVSMWQLRALRPLLSLCLSVDLQLCHVLLFLVSRMACVQFTAHCIFPHATLSTTKAASAALCMLSAALFLDLPAVVSERNNSKNSQQHGSWAQVVVGLREIQAECDSAVQSPSLHCSGDLTPPRSSSMIGTPGSGGGGGAGGAQQRKRSAESAAAAEAIRAAIAAGSNRRRLWS